MSWWLETPTVDWWMGRNTTDAVFAANLASYSLLALVPAYLLFVSSGRKSLQDAITKARITPRPAKYRDDGNVQDSLDFFYPDAELEIKSPDGRLAISHDLTGHTLWDMDRQEEICHIEAETDFSVATFSNHRKYVASDAQVWSCENGALVIASNALGLSHAFSPDDKLFAATDENAVDRDSADVCVWSLPSGALLRRLETFDSYAEVEFWDPTRLVVKDSRHGVRIYNTVDWKIVPL